MLYTIGFRESYDIAVERNPVYKLGPRPAGVCDLTEEPYRGGIAFRTIQDAQLHLDLYPGITGYAVYGLEGEFDQDTAWIPEEERFGITRDLLIVYRVEESVDQAA